MDSAGGDALDAAFRTMRAGFDQLLALTEDRALEQRDTVGTVDFIQEFERIRNQLALIDHQIIRDAQRRGLANELSQPNLPKALAATLQISVGEGARRVRAADAVAERTSMLGETLAPLRPHLAAAQRAGEISAEQVDIIERALAKVSGPGFDPADVAWGEEHLAGQARTFGPGELRRLAERLVDGINPDGTLPDDKLQADRRHFTLKPLRDGGWAGEFRLTGECGSKLQALLGPLAKPRLNISMTEDGRLLEEPDPRHHGQRMHDALEDVCDRLLRSENAVPDSGGTPATVIVTFELTDLLNRTGYAVASDGTLIPTDKALQLADAADVYFAAVTAKGEVLNLGRQRRIASRAQTVALIARDGGCSFPGCDTAPEWCERHHVIAWIDGGLTDLDNLTLLCRYHHHNFLAKGWECEINPDGLPEWRPPWYLDRERRPMINTRILGAISAARVNRRQ